MENIVMVSIFVFLIAYWLIANLISISKYQFLIKKTSAFKIKIVPSGRIFIFSIR
jgi:hypothetical protein